MNLSDLYRDAISADLELLEHEALYDSRNHMSPPPLYESDESEMCDACPYCREVCGDGEVDER